MVFPKRLVPENLKIAEWLAEISGRNAGIYIREGYEPPYLPKVMECLGAAFRP
jgi:hypothetical protein